jgi:pentatricopeptide repeat protein
VEAGYRFHDMMLERLLELAGEDTTVILVSDHGFHSDHLRPKKLSNAPAAPAAQHNPYGIFAAKGPYLRRDELVFGSTLKDITPTILDLFGLPIGKDMCGKPILQIYEKAEKPEYIKSWENIEGDCGMHSEEKRNDPWAEKEAMDQLIALGYIEPPGENIKENLDKSALEAKYYLARVYMDSNKYKEALPILEAIHSAKPEIKRYSLYLIKCFLELKEPEKALEIFEELKQQTEKMSAGLNLLAGKLYLALDKVDRALNYLKNAEKQDTDRPGIFLQLGQVYLKKKYSDKAITVFRKAIKIDNQNAMGYFGLGRGYFLQRRFSKAAEEFITAIGLLYHFPQAHYFLGESLFRLKIYDNALEAFKITVKQAPGLELAHKRLIK